MADERPWQLRAIEAARGNRTLVGCILLAILGKSASNPPRIVSGGVIDKDGIVWAGFQARGRVEAEIIPITRVAQMTDGFRALADRLKLNDRDREHMFEELRKWITEDKRAVSSPGDQPPA